MTSNRRSLRRRHTKPSEPAPKPKLDAEWRLMIVFPSGYVHIVECASQVDAFAMGRKTKQKWWVERRYVTPWTRVTPDLRVVIAEDGRPTPEKEFDPNTIVDDQLDIDALEDARADDNRTADLRP